MPQSQKYASPAARQAAFRVRREKEMQDALSDLSY